MSAQEVLYLGWDPDCRMILFQRRKAELFSQAPGKTPDFKDHGNENLN